MTQKKLGKLNDLLRQELGDQGGRYAWLFSDSEELMRPMRVCSPDGKPVYNERTVETKISGPDGKPFCVVLHDPIFTKRKTCLGADKQWVLCRLLPPALSREKWEEVFQFTQAYPENGEWAPCDPIYLPQGVEPDESNTWEVIHAFRRQRKITQADDKNAVEEAISRRESEHRKQLMDALHDDKPAFANAPGMKGHVSFPSVTKTKQESHASSNI